MCILIAFTAIFYVNNPYRRIEHYVNKNHVELTVDCKNFLKNGVVEKNYDGIKIDGIFGDEYKIVQFYFSGFGIAPSSKYYGFYYSPKDIPVTYQNDNSKLIKKSQNEWEWNSSGDNGGIIRKIQECWYYYEAWF